MDDLNLIIEAKTRKIRKGDSRYFDLNEEATLLLVSGYNIQLRARIIKEWRFYHEAFNNRQWRHDDTDVLKLVKKYQSEFEELGEVRFETALNTQGSSTEYAVLNEDQATYLITLFTNTDIVRKFKLRLVKEFRNALNTIAQNFADPPRTNLVTDKRKSMWDMTDALKEIRAELGKD
ncbi:MAG: Rha family transcriptional regulator, partial [Betaproteobacteria bacterium]